MINLGAMYTKITADTKGLNKAAKSVKKFSTTAVKNFKKVTKAATLIGTAAATATAAIALNKFNAVLRESVQLAGVQEQAEVKLASVIRATGGAAGFTSGELIKYAGELQKVTTYGDEVTISAMSILATFKNIKGDNFKAATRAAQDMATIMNQDLNSAMVLLGKALNDPLTGLSALTRNGVTFTEQQKTQIKTMVKSGQIVKAQKEILKELEGQFKGSAEAARETFGGALIVADNALGDLKEEIGFTITKNKFFVESLQKIESVFIEWTGVIKENKATAMVYTKGVALGFLSIGKAILVTMDLAYRFGKGVEGVFKGLAATALLLSSTIFNEIQSLIAGFAGHTTALSEEYSMARDAAFAAAEDLESQSYESFKAFADGAKHVQAAEKALAGLQNELESIPAVSIEVSSSSAEKASDSIGKVYGDVLKLGEAQEKLHDTEKVEKYHETFQGVWTNITKEAQEGMGKATSSVDKLGGSLEKVYGDAIKLKDAEIKILDSDNIQKNVGKPLKEVIGKTKELHENFEGVWTNGGEKAKDNLGDIHQNMIKILDTSKEVERTISNWDATVNTSPAEGRKNGGPIQALKNGGNVIKAAAGRFFPGFGGGDKIRILGEAGEFMLNKFAVRDAGQDTAAAFNNREWGKVISNLTAKLNMTGPAMPSFSGPSLATAGGGSTTSSNTNISGNEAPRNYYIQGSQEPVTVRADEKNAMMLLSALRRTYINKRV